MTSSTPRLSCFMAYDIRGRVPEELSPELAYRIGYAYAGVIRPRGPVVVGWAVRDSSHELARAVARGLNEAGVHTRSLGLCGTETVYYAASLPGMGGGIMITASHNPKGYNGLKLVREESRPISGESGLPEIEALACESPGPPAERRGLDEAQDVLPGYLQRLLSFVDTAALRPLHLVVNAGNGAAGPTFDALASRLPFRVTRIHHSPDPAFPNGIPNPLLRENRAATAEAVRAHRADMGIAWDGDFDRCFLFDERGEFIEGYYIVGLLAQAFLRKHPGEKIVHDPRLTWNTIDVVRAAGGIPVQSKTGHAFIKERMRLEDAVYGGEMSAHHYFRDFAYCDSGMIPWLLVAELMSATRRPLSGLVAERIAAFPCSGEINFCVADPSATIERVLAHYARLAPQVDRTDGLSAEFEGWRFNLRASNTEALLRLNLETRADPELMRRRTHELSALIEAKAYGLEGST
jgi:phosphomannomutase